MLIRKMLVAATLTLAVSMASAADPVFIIREPVDDGYVSSDGFTIVAEIYGTEPGDLLTFFYIAVIDWDDNAFSSDVRVECNVMELDGDITLMGNWRKRMCKPIQRAQKLSFIADVGPIPAGHHLHIKAYASFEGKVTADDVYVDTE